MKRACNWGWQPDESRHKWPYLHAYAIAAELLQAMDDAETVRKLQNGLLPAPEHALMGLARLPEIIVDTRVEYLRQGLAKQEKEWRRPLDEAFAELDESMALRQEAMVHLSQMETALHEIERGPDDFPTTFASFLSALKAHCRAMFMAIDHIQRAWGLAPSVEEMIISMYRYLYEIYPPKFLEILASTLNEGEADQEPKLI